MFDPVLKAFEPVKLWVFNDFLCVFTALHLIGPGGLISEVEVGEWVLLKEQMAILDVWVSTLLFDDCI